MTLKELINSCSYKAVFNILHKHYFSDWDTDRCRKMDVGFLSTWNELSNLNSSHQSDDKIYVINAEIDGSEEILFDVCYFSEKEEELYSIDFINWSELINLEIVNEYNFDSDKELLAHILYEITFWGFSNESIQSEAKKLQDSIEDFSK
tara:strand:+ start:4204 stop:4650 length:447 start_codon:yes stop_codon:yes gene_type:complete